IPAAEMRLKAYPHQLSGGMRQRVMIAMALINHPKLLIADEPTTALDVTIQAQILALLNTLKEETGTAVLMITHDLGVVAGICDKVLVMYAGRTMEYGNARDVFYQPAHPYSIGLLNAVPRLDAEGESLLT
ncbi:ATP-binding cassette domain-containing protein, partial [Klebsiella aerogenes]|uniref:ATP-binding cassette domain-containing protein n=1 Tax=Klebsiella aerogenes TaxID=548 RepID=UPI00292E41BB